MQRIKVAAVGSNSRLPSSSPERRKLPSLIEFNILNRKNQNKDVPYYYKYNFCLTISFYLNSATFCVCQNEDIYAILYCFPHIQNIVCISVYCCLIFVIK